MDVFLSEKQIEQLKVGDKIAWGYWAHGKPYLRLGQVQRITPAQIITEGGRFNKYGRIIGARSGDRISYLVDYELAQKAIDDKKEEER